MICMLMIVSTWQMQDDVMRQVRGIEHEKVIAWKAQHKLCMRSVLGMEQTTNLIWEFRLS